MFGHSLNCLLLNLEYVEDDLIGMFLFYRSHTTIPVLSVVRRRHLYFLTTLIFSQAFLPEDRAMAAREAEEASFVRNLSDLDTTTKWYGSTTEVLHRLEGSR